MKKIISFAFFCFIYSCTPTLKISSFTPDSERACLKPVFVKTMIKTTTNDGFDLSLYQLTKDAQSALGGDASIQNVHWDIQGGKKISVIYDVIRCAPDSLNLK